MAFVKDALEQSRIKIKKQEKEIKNSFMMTLGQRLFFRLFPVNFFQRLKREWKYLNTIIYRKRVVTGNSPRRLCFYSNLLRLGDGF